MGSCLPMHKPSILLPGITCSTGQCRTRTQTTFDGAPYRSIEHVSACKEAAEACMLLVRVSCARHWPVHIPPVRCHTWHTVHEKSSPQQARAIHSVIAGCSELDTPKVACRGTKQAQIHTTHNSCETSVRYTTLQGTLTMCRQGNAGGSCAPNSLPSHNCTCTGAQW